MDTRKDEKEKQVAEIDFNAKRQELETDTKQALALIDKRLKSRWMLSSTRRNLRLIRWLIVDSAWQTDIIYRLAQQVITQARLDETFSTILDILNTRMKQLEGNTTEIENVKSKIDDLLKHPAVQEITKAIENMQKVAEKRDKTREKILRDSIV